ncbi:hypothetical protein KP509_39G020400 [Ceratopteris richardii]|uniref:Exostosin GT47 domain-containing protein n=1 Tax=Ceratopteris richardii TaxID=49495 RepID=A0A8T2PZG5_CERRI|nr:hypothetical protein KP509_39G020400 [Ceratopteris richardii]
MRNNLDVCQRATVSKDRHIVTMRMQSPGKSKVGFHQPREGALFDRIQGRLWKQYVKVCLLCLAVISLYIVMLRPQWLLYFSDNDTVEPIPSVLHTGGRAIDSGSMSRSLLKMDLKHEGVTHVVPKLRLKKVHADTSSPLNYSIDVNEGVNNSLGLSKNIRIYVYELPSAFNVDWLKDDRCSNHLFAAEVAIHQRLLSSPVRTMDPVEADYFFVPVYVACNFNTTTGLPSLRHARSQLGAAVKYVSRKMPYWSRNKGRDHIFIATHDHGPCFHTMEDAAVVAGIPSFLQNSIILQTFGLTDRHACRTNNSIIIPPYVDPRGVKEGWSPDLQQRDIWVYFRGKMEIHPKNISGRIYSRGVRSMIWKKFGRNRRFFIKRSRTSGYLSEMRRSVFCLCPLGWAPWSPRIVESAIAGCIPVIIADKIALPYSHVINWSKISVTVPEKDVDKLSEILDRVAESDLTTIQENLWDERNRRALLYMDPLTPGDATWQILDVLSQKASNWTHHALQ